MTNQTTQRTVRQLTPAVGASVRVRFEDLTIECKVMDAKNSYGKVRLLVQPVAGTGLQWIELGRLVAAESAQDALQHNAYMTFRQEAR
jgi:hypothetical protein